MRDTNAEPPTGDASSTRADGLGFEGIPDPIGSSAGESGVARHDVPVEAGLSLRLYEHHSPEAWSREPRRAVLFLPGTATRGDFWSIPVPGYNGTNEATRRGFFAFTVDYIGVGENYRPGFDASDSTFERNLAALEAVVRYIRYRREVLRIDVVGESWGGAFASQLAGDPSRIRSCVMSSMTYRAVGDPRFLAPEFVAFLRSLPDNYLPNPPDFYDAITVGADKEVIEFARRSQPGKYLTTQLWQIINGLPHFDPGIARTPGLVVSGSAEASDGRALAAEYGSEGAQFCEIAGGGHVPRAETPDRAKRYWDEVFRFLEAT